MIVGDAGYGLIFLLMALPIPFGINDTTKGSINVSTVHILDITISLFNC